MRLIQVSTLVALGALLTALTVVHPVAAADKPDSTEQLWFGELDVGVAKLRLLLKVSPTADGHSAKFVSLDQGGAEIPVDSVVLDDTTLEFKIEKIRGEFSGQLNEVRDEARGKWIQLGRSMELTLRHVEEVPQANRPQTPHPPFPYRTVDVSIKNEKANVVLAGTLTLPEGKGMYPAVVLITGSGPQDRDETLLGHKPFLVLADHLTRSGIAVLRYDDRGFAQSTGNYGAATTLDFAADARAAVQFLQGHPEVDDDRIGLLGHSSGALAACQVAANAEDIAFVVMIASPGVPGDEVIREQAKLLLQAMGTPPDEVAADGALRRAVMDAVKDSQQGEKPADVIARGLETYLATLPEAERESAAPTKASMRQLEMYLTPWFRFLLSYDPRPVLKQVDCPVLAVYGERDIQVPSRQNLGEVQRALESRQDGESKVVELSGLNHLLQSARTGLPSEYAEIAETMSPKALELISEWIRGQVGPE
jgi:pimeloyl-ACP methyl ester carboxylesterase